jgi:hypothetical protein
MKSKTLIIAALHAIFWGDAEKTACEMKLPQKTAAITSRCEEIMLGDSSFIIIVFPASKSHALIFYTQADDTMTTLEANR